MTPRVVLGYLWAAPWTLLAAALTPLVVVTGGGAAVHTGVLELWGGLLRRGLPRLGPDFQVAAITLGHAVLAVDRPTLEATRAHERIHVAQYQRWGVLFPLVYGLASVAARLRGAHYYRDNRFEREARGEA
ncbi:MAG: hypothetical protein SFV24_19425 [Gemmatimonadales bacterium]|nr:hypothetical protein [Gemmatimonadales bacterium]